MTKVFEMTKVLEASKKLIVLSIMEFVFRGHRKNLYEVECNMSNFLAIAKEIAVSIQF